MRAIIVLALLGSALAAVPRSPKGSNNNRIVGGTLTTIEEYPYMANMLFGWFGSGFSQSCGGTLITPLTILSASHCYETWPSAWWRTRLGTSFRSTGGVEHIISSILLHPQYDDPVLDNDVAIVRLSSAAVLTATVQLASIAGPNYVLPDGTSITAIGWGTTQSGGFSSEQLRHVDIDIINQELCAQRYAELKLNPQFRLWPDITDGMLCAGILDVGGKDACQGDSGGPVAHNGNVIVGVTSWGYGCGDSYYPGVLARVSYYSNWIVQNA